MREIRLREFKAEIEKQSKLRKIFEAAIEGSLQKGDENFKQKLQNNQVAGGKFNTKFKII